MNRQLDQCKPLEDGGDGTRGVGGGSGGGGGRRRQPPAAARRRALLR